MLVPTAPGFVTITRASVRRGSSMLRAVDRLNLSIARAGGAGGRVGRWKDRRGARHPAIAGARQRIDTLRGTDITHLEKPALRPLRRRMQMIFRALNPRLKVPRHHRGGFCHPWHRHQAGSARAGRRVAGPCRASGGCDGALPARILRRTALARISHRIRCIGARILRESCCDHGFSQIHRTPQCKQTVPRIV